MALADTFTSADGHWISITVSPPYSDRSVIAARSNEVSQIWTVEDGINLLDMSFESFDRLVLIP